MAEKGKKPSSAAGNNKGKPSLTIIKLQIEAGKANPAPPVGPALGQHGVNIMEFCKAYNEATKDKMGQVIPVEIYVTEDRKFTFKLKSPPASALIIKKLGIPKGSGTPNSEKVGKITKAQLLEIVKEKWSDLTAKDEENAIRTIAGTARSMGVDVVE